RNSASVAGDAGVSFSRCQPAATSESIVLRSDDSCDHDGTGMARNTAATMVHHGTIFRFGFMRRAISRFTWEGVEGAGRGRSDDAWRRHRGSFFHYRHVEGKRQAKG